MLNTLEMNRDLLGKFGRLEQRVILLEEYNLQYQDRLENLEDQSIRLENTLRNESRETRVTMTEQTEKLFNIVDSSMNYKSASRLQEHEIRMLKINTFSTVFLKVSGGIVGLLSAGGGAYYLLQQLLG